MIALSDRVHRMPDKSDTQATSPDRTHGSERPVWHALEISDALRDLETRPGGLTAEEAQVRLADSGPNALPAAAGKSALQRLLAQFDNLLIYVLIGAAIISALLGRAIDASVIVAVVILNAVIGFLQEGRAEQALDSIRDMISPKASALREGRRVTLRAAEIVPGDLLLLEAGDRVSADVRLSKTRNLRIDEAILTGESVPEEKTTDPVAPEALLGDRRCMAYSGTLVTAGLGTGVVVATGLHSEIGRISAILRRVEQLETPLIRQMNEFARQLTIIILGLSAVTFAFAVIIRGYALPEAFMVMVGMAVAAIPEGLPAVMTITLAIGVQRMAARNAIIRRLPAVETLGSISTICSDKTGTLTRNEMTVTKVVLAGHVIDVGGTGYAPRGGFSVDGHEIDPTNDATLSRLARAALLCNDASLRPTDDDVWTVDGDPMEGALVAFGLKTGHDHQRLANQFPRLDEIPFDAAHRYMATLHHGHDHSTFACIKGAPENILEMCVDQAAATGEVSIDKGYWLGAIDKLAHEGHRVLAIASRSVPPEKRDLEFEDIEHGLTLEGIVGLIDPPRPEAITAIEECQNAGIAVAMITGDHAATASAIANKLGLASPDTVATGQDLDALDPPALRRAVATTNVFARTSPENKLRLVEAMQAGGAVIAMTGDGVNDAPALKRADVGVAMGLNGTEVAKEAADMVLIDDNFTSIVAAVREGRTVYDNLTKVIGWTLPTSGGEMLIIIVAILFGLALPITPVQILWINMVTVVCLGLVLAFEPPEPDTMQRPPRSANATLLSGLLLWRIIFVSILFAIGAFSMFAWAETHGASNEQARTIVVNAIVAMEIFYLFSVRHSLGASLTWRSALGTPAVLIGVGLVVALQLGFSYLPFMQLIFQTRPVALADALAAIGAGMALFVIMEIEKRVVREFFSGDSLDRNVP
jgi:magnesium-transporting ATPase (P-type)